ncbi:MAG: helix-hairpin-helix domain-containing protein, partial [bacterium]
MKLAQFFSRILNRETVVTVPTGTPVVADHVPVGSTPHDVPESLATLVSGFSSIQSLLKDDEAVELPAAALLARLPEAMRGPAWQNGSFPDTCLLVDPKSLYEQLQKGRLQYPVEQFSKEVPPGWLKAEATGLVDLDLAQVVEAMPPAFFGELAPVSSEMREISGMHDYFTPKPQIMPPPVPVVSATLPAPTEVTASAPPEVITSAPPEVTAPVPVAPITQPVTSAPVAVVATVPEVGPTGWDGVETRLEAGGQSVDINLATVDGLRCLRGIGPRRAKQLIDYRQSIGRFNSIFDLAKVPGLGGAAFSKLTGLSLKQPLDRHQLLNRILALPVAAVPSLAEIIVASTTVTGAAAGVLTNHDGMPLAVHGMERDEAETNAAITPQLF